MSKSCLFRVDGDVKSLKSPVFCFRCFTKKPDGHFVSCALTASVNVDEKKNDGLRLNLTCTAHT